jgi:hypothetical protein
MSARTRQKEIENLDSPCTEQELKLLFKLQKQMPSTRFDLVNKKIIINDLYERLQLIIPEKWKIEFDEDIGHVCGIMHSHIVTISYYLAEGFSCDNNFIDTASITFIPKTQVNDKSNQSN